MSVIVHGAYALQPAHRGWYTVRHKGRLTGWSVQEATDPEARRQGHPGRWRVRNSATAFVYGTAATRKEALALAAEHHKKHLTRRGSHERA